MKKLLNQLLFLSAIGGMLFMTACGDDDEETPVPAPEIFVELTSGQTITDGVISAESGSTLVFDVDISAPAGFNTLRVSGSGQSGTILEVNRNNLGLDAGITVVPTIPVTINLPEVSSTTSTTLTFLVVDDANGQSSETVEVEIQPVDPNVEIYNEFLLAAPLGDGSSDTFFSTTLGLRYSDDDVLSSTQSLSAEIDFGYYYGATNLASLAGIATYPTDIVNVDAWNVQNNTVFRSTTMTTAEFDAITEFDAADITAEFEVGSSEAGQKTQLAAGTILAFRTDATKTGGSKFGLLKVVSITGTDGQGDGINIEVKVQL